jgi:hypothetical protein
MATTTNYSWTTPDNTAYVKDGASAIRTLGSSVDTTLYTALGGAYPGLRLIKKQTIGSGVSSVICTSAFSATYANYLIQVNDTTMSVVNANVSLQMRTGSTTATTSYFGGLPLLNYSTGAASGVVDNNTSAFSFVARSFTTSQNSFGFNLYQPFLANRTVVNGLGFVGADVVGNYNGYHNSATSYDQFVLTPAAGTFTGGTIYVYGYGIS